MNDELIFHRLISLDQIAVGTQREVEIQGTRILLCHTAEGLFAVQALCSHAHKPLLGGRIDRCVLRCPHHAGKFDLRSGKALEAPAFTPLRCFPLRVVDGHIEVALTNG